MKMKKVNYFFVLLLLLTVYSCDERLGNALERAGTNRRELVEVLEHYKDDSLKLEAAKFLIENMYHSYYKEGKSINDINVITSEYLIKDIDSAFYGWEHSPWKKEIDFDTFCRFILPYRVANEPLSYWRDTLRNEYKHLIVDIKDPIRAFEKVYSAVLKQFEKLGTAEQPFIDIMTLHQIKKGTCGQRGIYVGAVLRSLGIPAAFDFVPFWGNYSTSSHAWVSYTNRGRTFTVYGNDSIAKEFNLIDGCNFNDPGELIHPHHQWDSIKRVPVIMRLCYELQSPLEIIKDKNMPAELKDLFLINVSRQYGFTHHVEFASVPNGDPYLYAFDTGRGWRAVTKGETHNSKVVFKDLPGKMVYLPFSCYKKHKRPMGNPFLLDENGNTHFFKPDLRNCRKVTIWRKYPLRKQWYNRWKQFMGTTIEVSDDSLFRNKRIVYAFDTPVESIIEKSLDIDRPYRFIRILSDTAKRPEIAVFKVFAKYSRKRMNGRSIFHDVPASTVGQIFDDDYMTYASKMLPGYWVGLDLGEDNKDIVGGFELCPRHDMNMIRKGEKYELFYYDKEWKSLGVQMAQADSLIYRNVPDNALLWLRSKAGEIEERIFTFKDGKQIWW